MICSLEGVTNGKVNVKVLTLMGLNTSKNIEIFKMEPKYQK